MWVPAGIPVPASVILAGLLCLPGLPQKTPILFTSFFFFFLLMLDLLSISVVLVRAICIGSSSRSSSSSSSDRKISSSRSSRIRSSLVAVTEAEGVAVVEGG